MSILFNAMMNGHRRFFKSSNDSTWPSLGKAKQRKRESLESFFKEFHHSVILVFLVLAREPSAVPSRALRKYHIVRKAWANGAFQFQSCCQAFGRPNEPRHMMSITRIARSASEEPLIRKLLKDSLVKWLGSTDPLKQSRNLAIELCWIQTRKDKNDK